jgi:thiaminase (transcriptional activator TenA)
VTGSTSQELIDRASDLWSAATDHPFVDGIRTGSLPRETFAYYLAQDYVFLVGYCRVFGLATAKAPDLETMGFFSTLLHETLHTEMDLHRELSATYGVSAQQLEATEPSPTCRGYVDHLLRVAALDGIDAIATSLLPCQLGYAQIGQTLQEEGADTPNNPYAEWIRTYADPQFQALAHDVAALVDRTTAGADADRRDQLFEIFAASCRYEHAFWDAAWAHETWENRT